MPKKKHKIQKNLGRKGWRTATGRRARGRGRGYGGREWRRQREEKKTEIRGNGGRRRGNVVIYSSDL